MRILLITGGWSGERQVALNGAKALNAAMLSLGHVVEIFDLLSLEGLKEATERNDFAFINLHGSPGEDGLVQSFLERLNFPYQGSGPGASMLALDKATAKVFFKDAGLPVAPSFLLTQRPEQGWAPDLPFPLFIKDNVGGSTINLEYVATPDQLDAALDRLFAVANNFIVESAVTGTEITCGVIGKLQNGVEVPIGLPPILIRPKKSGSGLFDYESKYTAGGAEEICPAPISAELTEMIQTMTVKAHCALGLSGYSRADFIVPLDAKGNLAEGATPIILEVNTLPGLTATSLIPQELAVTGVSFAGMVERLIELGMHQRGR